MSGLGQHIEYAQNFIAQVDAQHARDVARESAMSYDIHGNRASCCAGDGLCCWVAKVRVERASQ